MGKFNYSITRPLTLYDNECWAVKSQQENKHNVPKMRMLHWFNRHTKQKKY